MDQQDTVIADMQQTIASLESQLALEQSSCNATQLDYLKFMHERAWNRISWYRTEMWRISLAIYTGLIGMIAVIVQYGPSIKALNIDHSTLMTWYCIVGSAIVGMYALYLHSLAKAAKYCNGVLDNREKQLSIAQNTQQTLGFRIGLDGEDADDTAYNFLKKQKPTLESLKISFAVMLLIVGGCFLHAAQITGLV